MLIGILGINHKSADLPLREKLACACDRLFGSPRFLHHLFSYVLLSTCNRTEIYFHSDDLAETHTYLLNSLRHYIEEEFEHRIYSYFGSDCFFHLARVTAGVDSALIGETEIQGQVKRAYEAASVQRLLASPLHFLFQKCLKIGKQIRATMPSELLSIEEAVVNSARTSFQDFRQTKALLIGLSEINHKILHRLKKLQLKEITLCNRTDEKASELANRENFNFLPWAALQEWIHYDWVICGTKSLHFLLFEPTQAITAKLVIDLSVPRNVDPKVGRHLTLLNVDQLNQVLDNKRRLRAQELARLESHLIAQSVARQLSLFKQREQRHSTHSIVA